MKKIIISILVSLVAGLPAMSQPSIIGFWHAETESEYDVRITFKEDGKGLMEYRDYDHETLKFHCESWDFKWRFSGDSIVLEGLPWKCILKFDQRSDSLRPVYSGGQCNSISFSFESFVKSTITDSRKYYVERWQLHECEK